MGYVQFKKMKVCGYISHLFLKQDSITGMFVSLLYLLLYCAITLNVIIMFPFPFR